MPWYRVGQVAITAGQNTVTGTGTAFSANARVGDAFQGPDGRWYEVTNIASATVLSILPAYQGVTVAGGSYALAPMQGYVKESADRLRQIVNDWGSTLAGLGSVSTENVVPVAKGGTGGTTPALARSGLGLKSAAVADIVGAVSQSGGVPTGAIIERGSNANGEYTKYADGTMTCGHVHRVDTVLTSIIMGTSWTFPAAFNTNRPIIVGCTALQGGSIDAAPLLQDRFHVVVTTPSGTGVSVRCIASGAVSFVSGNFIDVHVTANGRWYN